MAKIYFLTYQHTEGLCGKCLKQVIVRRQKIRIWPNAVLAILTFGIWGIFWYKNTKAVDKNWRCALCNSEVYQLLEVTF